MPSTRAKPVLLVADDDPEILSMLSLRLRHAGYEVLTAPDGQQAMLQVHAHHPELVILDVMMPIKNGWEVARELRHTEATRHIGIIVLSAIGEKVNEITSPLYGVDEHLDKPFEFTDLERLIARVLTKRRKEREA